MGYVLILFKIESHYILPAGLPLQALQPHSDSQVLGLQAGANTPSLIILFFFNLQIAYKQTMDNEVCKLLTSKYILTKLSERLAR